MLFLVLHACMYALYKGGSEERSGLLVFIELILNQGSLKC